MKAHHYELRGILSDHADAHRLVWNALTKITMEWIDSDCDIKLDYIPRSTVIHVLRHVDEHFAKEIELLFDKNGNVYEAVECEHCGEWNAGEYCQREDCVTTYCDKRYGSKESTEVAS